MKVMTIVGTRPEIIRLSRVIARLDTTEGLTHVLVHTGQNYDPNLNEVFFADLRLRSPDHQLSTNTESLGSMLGTILMETERVLDAERPDAVLILGDTNSSIASIMAKRKGVPVFHMEAGNRCFDDAVPEETNRRLVDHVADYNLAYTEHARRNLLNEGVHSSRVYVTGSPMYEVLHHYQEDIRSSEIVTHLGLKEREYFVVSAHREENVDSVQRLGQLVDSLRRVHETWKIPLVVSTHPRTRKRLEALGRQVPGDIRWLDPFGFHDYNRLQSAALCVLSDSGTIAEEAAMLQFRAITLRDAIERPEALDSGGICLTGVDPERVVQGISWALERPPGLLPNAYQVPNTSGVVINVLLSQYWKRSQANQE